MMNYVSHRVVDHILLFKSRPASTVLFEETMLQTFACPFSAAQIIFFGGVDCHIFIAGSRLSALGSFTMCLLAAELRVGCLLCFWSFHLGQKFLVAGNKCGRVFTGPKQTELELQLRAKSLASVWEFCNKSPVSVNLNVFPLQRREQDAGCAAGKTTHFVVHIFEF